MISASLGLKPKKDASNISTSSNVPLAFTKLDWRINEASMPSDSRSSSEKNDMDSTPARKFSQNCLRLRAPGKRPDIPMMATPSRDSDEIDLLILPSSSQRTPSASASRPSLSRLGLRHAPHGYQAAHCRCISLRS